MNGRDGKGSYAKQKTTSRERGKDFHSAPARRIITPAKPGGGKSAKGRHESLKAGPFKNATECSGEKGGKSNHHSKGIRPASTRNAGKATVEVLQRTGGITKMAPSPEGHK